VIDYTPRNPAGPLASVIEVRRGPDDAHTGGIEHREALVYTLGKAAELEHLIMLQYLFAAFSLKQSVDEGLSPDQLAAVQRWRTTLPSRSRSGRRVRSLLPQSLRYRRNTKRI